ncbi:MAG: hypothetical protein A2X25_12440 [Chloroflexi bacterium GWB2_49_20]|nr:MAG: hypothetical protein A2X25_12440 [Chloroflexi bacterium GWB2_49_20]OGN78470.1 MAG: hypothetical protein A2X26_01760 [Chloroflexi bacterium GWC2_49_37]OGN84067.1 MAG: hypothetical protein A2X27_13925 [Chloroflexi bacterium GWD2_49_16]HBG75288.1 hypothetical protein [Anaerolineae bacterium]HCC79078.1 hypothetical protein [Anaerolineae bacterium]
MTKLEINALATRALTDRNFEAAILNGHRYERLQEFQLPVGVVNAIMQIKGENLQQFIYQLNDLVNSPVAL